MSGAVATARAFGLASPGAHRLGAAAQQRTEMPLGLGPCGGLTRRQIEGFSLAGRAWTLPALARWLGRLTPRQIRQD